LGAGGSSGGEGALVAMRGSPLGVGTDVAGITSMFAFKLPTLTPQDKWLTFLQVLSGSQHSVVARMAFVQRLVESPLVGK
jgi:hypothetical protein